MIFKLAGKVVVGAAARGQQGATMVAALCARTREGMFDLYVAAVDVDSSSSSRS